MNKEETKSAIKVMQAYVDGKDIQHSFGSTWYSGPPSWSWSDIRYRLKPTPTGSERVIEMLKQGKPVLCTVSDVDQVGADENNAIRRIMIHTATNDLPFQADNGATWKYTSPVDLSKFAS